MKDTCSSEDDECLQEPLWLDELFVAMTIIICTEDESTRPKGILMPDFTGNALECDKEVIGLIPKSRKDWWISDFPVLTRRSDE